MNSKLFIFSIKNAFRRKGILLIAMIGTGLGTALMATLVSLSNGMDAELTRTVNLVASEITVSAEDSETFSLIFGGATPIPSDYAEQILDIEGVLNVQPSVITSIPASSLQSSMPVGSSLNGLDLEIDKEIEGATTQIIEGRSIENQYELLMGSQINSRPSSNVDVNIGDEIEIPIKSEIEAGQGDEIKDSSIGIIPQIPDPTNQNETVSSITQPEMLTFKIVGVFETGNSFADGGFAGSIKDVREVAGYSDEQVSNFTVEAEDTELVEGIAKEIEELFQDEEIPVTTTLAKDVLGELNDTLSIFRTFILVISLVSAVAGGMSIFIIMLMSVIERLQEFGIFKATGWSNSNIILSVIIESITVALLGSFVGLGVGFIIGRIINSEIGSEIALFDINLILLILGFGITMGVLGGVLPAIKAARVSPIETLQSV